MIAVLAGASLADTATAAGLEQTDLAQAVETYRLGGRQALSEQEAATWRQIYVRFSDWDASEKDAVTDLAPLLHQAEAEGLISTWWFMRKHPCWRLRLRPGPAADPRQDPIGTALDHLAQRKTIHSWWPGVYEAETAAFGGEDGMAAAHQLFHDDSRAILRLLAGNNTGLGRRELSLLLCSTLMHAAGLEWYEQGDVWHRVAHERPLPPDVPTRKLDAMADSLRTLMLADTSEAGALFNADGPLTHAADWAGSFRLAGQNLGSRARTGKLQRGLRHVLSYHIIFHWNRLGLPARQQSILAWAARTAILGPPPEVTPPAAHRSIKAPASAPVDLVQIACRFPLIIQSRPRGISLHDRVRQVNHYASTCHEPDDAEERIDRACTAWNLAALIASDCALTDLAIELCERQFQIFQPAWPLSGRTTIAALQPIVNLARLDLRAHNPERAYQTLRQLHRAVQHGGDVDVHGTPVRFDGFTTSTTARTHVAPWLRTVLREDGTRALVAAQQWQRAASNAAEHAVPGEGIDEATQMAIISHTMNDDFDAAHCAIPTANLSAPWDQATAHCLRVFVDLASARPDPSILPSLLITTRRTIHRPDPKRATTQTRLGLAAVDLAAALDTTHASRLYTEVAQAASRSGDAFAARDVLKHPNKESLRPVQSMTLTALVERAALGQAGIEPNLLADLKGSLEIAGKALQDALYR
ncbi:thiopeptide-type bacteriocin biosynthesis protein [Actinomadura spongiicola]|uniref:thiopeptide-type bacteriocin biosynthesis protein n=1 Tax=Actinomadura spongiicola TaxID=2303421 RepID=UPI001F293175|nr:thiopeptide-type bacteriocin biosynthesis protein [Actinomadura spongiicola]